MKKILFLFHPNNALLEKLDEDTLFEYTIQNYQDIVSGYVALDGYEILVAAPFHRLNREFISLFPDLKVIILHGSGYDKVDVTYASNKGIFIFNIPDYIAVTVAEHALALILSLTRKIVLGDEITKKGQWSRGPPPRELVGTVIRGKKVGIVGLGRIGSEVAKLVSTFGAEVFYWNRRRKPEVEHALNLSYLNLQKLFKECDIIVITIALTQETENLINKSLIDTMKKGSILINVSRGGVLDESALLEALEKGKLGGVGLDVFKEEPLPVNHPLTKFKNVVLTPHIGGFSDYSSYYTSLDVYRILYKLFHEKSIPTENLVNEDVLENVKQ